MPEFVKTLLSIASPMVLSIAAASVYWAAMKPLNNEQAAFGLAVMIATFWITRDRSFDQ